MAGRCLEERFVLRREQDRHLRSTGGGGSCQSSPCAPRGNRWTAGLLRARNRPAQGPTAGQHSTARPTHLLRQREVGKAGGVEDVGQVGQYGVARASHGSNADQAVHAVAVQRGQQQRNVAACGGRGAQGAYNSGASVAGTAGRQGWALPWQAAAGRDGGCTALNFSRWYTDRATSRCNLADGSQRVPHALPAPWLSCCNAP